MGPTHGLHWSCCVFPYPPAAFLIEQRNSVLSWISMFLPKVYVGMPRSPCDGIGKPGLCAVSVTRAWNESWVWSPHHGVSALRKRLLRACFLCLCSLPCEDTTGRPHLKTGNRALVRHGVYLDLGPAILQNFVKGMFVVSTTHSMVISYSSLWKLTYDTSQVAIPRKNSFPISLILYSADLEVSVPKRGVLPPGGMTRIPLKTE